MNTQKRVAIFILLILLTPNWVDHVIARNGPQSTGITFPVVKRDALLNGLQLITIENAGTGNVTLRVRINSGVLFDLAGKGGLANLTAEMLFKGGGNYSAKSLQSTAADLGIHWRLTPGWDDLEIELSGPADAAEIMFDILGAILITPAFEAKEFEALKAQTVSTLKGRSNDAEIVYRKAMQAVFGTHPFGRPLLGTPESVQQITRFDLLYYHNKFFLANNAVLIASGDITAEQVTKLSRAKLGAWKKGDKVAPTFRPPDKRSGRQVWTLDRPEVQEAQAIIAQIGPSRRSPDYFAVLVLTEILRSSYAKQANGAVFLDYEPHLVDGPLTLRVKASPAEIAGAVERALALMSELQEKTPSMEQIEAAKAEVTARFAEQIKSDPAKFLLDIELYGLGRDYLVTYIDRVNAITAADVQRAAKNYLKPLDNAIVVAGPTKVYNDELKKIGTVSLTSEFVSVK